MRWVSALLLWCGCYDFAADLRTCQRLGRCSTPCTMNEQCGAGEACVSGVCERPAVMTCAATMLPGPTACGAARDLYLSPAGADSQPGTEALPRRTLAGLALSAGDRIHVGPGVYGSADFELTTDGRADCPITLEGAPDGGTVVLTSASSPMTLDASHWRISRLTFRARGFGSAGSAFTSSRRQLRDNVIFHVSAVAEDAVHHLAVLEFCEDCSIVASTFGAADGGEVSRTAFVAYSPRFVFRGNRVEGPTVQPAVTVGSSSAGALVEANTFVGARPARFESPDGAFVRNVVRDGPTFSNTAVLVQGAARVESNTFVNVGAALVSDDGEFRNNLVSLAGAGGPEFRAAGGYNLFNTVRPTRDGGAGASDVVALPQLDAQLQPLEGSPAIDAADPSSPVPLGGGVRADIGALERGATRGADGRLCFPDAGG